MTATLLQPSKVTLRKYGLTPEAWAVIADGQARVCYVCQQLPKSGRLHIDHAHVRGWKHMTPERRRQYIRGLLCFRCNTTYVGRSITAERSRRVTEYLERFRGVSDVTNASVPVNSS